MPVGPPGAGANTVVEDRPPERFLFGISPGPRRTHQGAARGAGFLCKWRAVPRPGSRFPDAARGDIFLRPFPKPTEPRRHTGLIGILHARGINYLHAPAR